MAHQLDGDLLESPAPCSQPPHCFGFRFSMPIPHRSGAKPSPEISGTTLKRFHVLMQADAESAGLSVDFLSQKVIQFIISRFV